ncbi:T9SS type A sorting domain-containing protein [Siansivirga zeaxanthinifaciens]|uniref:Secretion system C-terminal sorting domain-containing protein n=1 Tax=Siansivirga zeaxanthinifaciens CC-SAMT-1 TaxID=1454006 RepID=A0A0C5WPT2_9FLAO|nr:T9SS type A sorting domain-containing protein [Siansivirga zeaxanthinifaciens]AJR04950.1 hypothetical protein AW14_12365 [Siansivirga zeaxanthinifaciens CC-SAMT-1]
MFKKNLSFVFILLVTISAFAQNPWTFNNNSLNGWTEYRFDVSYNPSSLILTTKGQNNPRLDHATANVNADLYKFAIIKMKVATGGPSLLRINYGANFKSTIVTPGSSTFETYIINMTDVTWTGTVNDLQLAFKDNDGTAGGSTHNSNDVNVEIEKISFVENIYSGATELYVDLDNGNDNNIGSSSAPLLTIPFAIETAASNNIPNVYIKEGTYDVLSPINITTNSPTPIVVSPELTKKVTMRFSSNRNIRFYGGAKNIEFKDFNLDGQSNTTDHWTILANYVWQPELFPSALSGGAIAFQVEDAEDIKITNNAIHDFYQKAVNIEDGRYVTIKGNVIYNIALTSLSGGHGIMRQQGSGSFPANDPDDSNKYRWDIDGNLLFNIHQRIYSWVPTKGYLNMTLDEGKPILIDETPNHDLGMKARIQNNIVAYFKIDGIRIKPTNYLEVLNNSLFSTEPTGADGITDTTTGFTGSGTPFLNFKCFNNAVDVAASRQPYELAESIGSTGSTYNDNYASHGPIAPVDVADDLGTSLFKNAPNGDFTIVDGLPAMGVEPGVITDLVTRAGSFNVTIADNNWVNNHLKNAQTLFDNIPGVEDGIANNEPVFLDAGIYDASDLEFNKGRKSYYFTVNPTWKVSKGISDANLNRGNGLDVYDGKYEIVTPEAYSEWFDHIKSTYLRDTDGNNIGDTPYNVIRYGESDIRQDKVLNDNSLHVVEIESNTEYTTTKADGYAFTIDGDLLIDFKYTPVGNEVFDIVTAGSITSLNSGSLFDDVLVSGYSGTYTLEVVSGSPSILRLTLTDTTLGNKDFNLNQVVLYPNPSKPSEGFNINLPYLTKNNVRMFTTLGQEIDLSVNHTSNKVSHFTPSTTLAKGIYLITINTSNSTKKLKYLID